MDFFPMDWDSLSPLFHRHLTLFLVPQDLRVDRLFPSPYLDRLD